MEHTTETPIDRTRYAGPRTAFAAAVNAISPNHPKFWARETDMLWDGLHRFIESRLDKSADTE